MKVKVKMNIEYNICFYISNCFPYVYQIGFFKIDLKLIYKLIYKLLMIKYLNQNDIPDIFLCKNL